jgi:hypothetical protein
MSRRFRDDFRGSLVIPVGWLFADLLLALAMLFLVANTVPPPKKAITLTPTPTLIPTPTPTPKVAQSLDPNPLRFSLENLDYYGLLQNPPSDSALKAIECQVQSQTKSLVRRAGFVIAFGGAVAPDGTVNPSNGNLVAGRVEDVLRTLGKDGYIFVGTVYQDPLHDLESNLGVVELQIYLYTQSDYIKPPQPPQKNC